MKAVKRTAFCNGATVFIIFLVFSAHFEVVTLGEVPLCLCLALYNHQRGCHRATCQDESLGSCRTWLGRIPFLKGFAPAALFFSFPPFKVTSTNSKKAGKGWAAEPFLWKCSVVCWQSHNHCKVFFCARLEFRSGSEWMSMVQSPSTYFASNRVMWSWSNWRYSMWLCQEWDLEAQNCKCWHILIFLTDFPPLGGSLLNFQTKSSCGSLQMHTLVGESKVGGVHVDPAWLVSILFKDPTLHNTSCFTHLYMCNI